MLRPSLFVACEKVIFDQQIGVPASVKSRSGIGPASLISLFTKLTAVVPGEIPKDAVAPREWAVYSLWESDPGDQDKELFVCTQVLYPDESPFGQTLRTRVVVDPGGKPQVVTRIQAFPIGLPGNYTVRTWVEEGNRMVAGPISLKIELEILKEGASGG